MSWKHELRVCLLFAPIVALSLVIALWVNHAANASPHVFVDGVRGTAYPIILVIESPEAIHAEAIKRGMIEADWDGKVKGFAAFNNALTICTVWVPPLGFDTLWVWAHEIQHCNTGAFHDN